jgi:ATP-dependent RNA helicase MSS116
MSPVQADTLPPIRAGNDVLAKARTGTGKTLAFLLPQAERLLAPGNPVGISTVVLAPTRELALQIESEAKRIFSCSRATVTSVIGGRNMNSETRILKGKVDVLIATPGRLLDHLRSGNLNGKLSALRCVVMDECDMLMDMGFSKDIHAIMSFFPNKMHRQTLLFSATIPAAIRGLADDYCRPGYSFVDCVGQAVATHAHIPQTFVEADYGLHVPLLYSLLKDMPEGKAIVFFNTARMAQVVAEQLQASPIAKELGVFQMHSRCSQGQRTKTQKEFGIPSTRAVLLSSDASARGVDYPNVRLVVQIGVALNPAQHVHRVGRTGRAGHDGMAVVMCSPGENALRKHVCPTVPPHPAAAALLAKAAAAAPVLRKAMMAVSVSSRERAYVSWMGAYASSKNLLKWSFEKVASEAANVAATALAWEGPVPAVEQKVLKKMNMFNVAGVRSMPNKPQAQGQGRGGPRR